MFFRHFFGLLTLIEGILLVTGEHGSIRHHQAGGVMGTAEEEENEPNPSNMWNLRRVPAGIGNGKYREQDQNFADPVASGTKEYNDGVNAQLDYIAVEKQFELIKTYKDSMMTLLDELRELDLSGTTDDIKSIATIGKECATQAFKAVEDSTSFLKSHVLLVEGEDLSSMNDDGAVQSKSFTRSGDDRDEAHISSRGKVRRASIPNWRERQQRRRRTTKEQTFNRDDDNAFDFDGSFHQHPFYQRTPSSYKRHIHELNRAIHSGDIHSVFSVLSSGGRPRHDPAATRRIWQRRAKESHSNSNTRRLSKNEQCELLAECAVGMSRYDIFVYYYSDDIDPTTGEVDGNRIKFDESDILAKYDAIQSVAEAILENGWQQESCDGLLRLFHRTIEHGSIPEWEGASVNQVCLAEGTTIFVKYQEMVNALVDSSFPDGYNGNSENEWKQQVEEHVEMVAKNISVEPFRCAEDLFYHGNRTDPNEVFPFVGCGGRGNSSDCGIEKYTFPVEFDVTTSATRGQHYETIRKRIKCDRRYEIKTKEECIKAGLEVGGNLRSEELNEGDWDWVPCGCSIGTDSKKVIHWKTGSRCGNRNWAYSVVCKERRNRDDYELVLFQAECDPGYEIASREECEEAGQVMGGYFDPDESYSMLVVGDKDRPCGCSFYGSSHNSMFIRFNTAQHCEYRGNEPLVCKRKERVYASFRRRSQCYPDYEIQNQEQCKEAGVAVGGALTGGEVIEGDWDWVPCGCFIDTGANRVIRWTDRSAKCKNQKWQYALVCKQHPAMGEKYKKVQFATECAAGDVITTEKECEKAGQEVGGVLNKGGLTLKDLKHTPCGCFVDFDGNIIYDSGTKGCGNREYEYESVCHQHSIGYGTARDIHGKLISNDVPAFVQMDYDQVDSTADHCIDRELAGVDTDCLEDTNKEYNSAFYECRVTAREKAIAKCNRFGPIQTALELVFGAQSSPGFICGISDAVVKDGLLLPGRCCLDAPYQQHGDSWGHPYDCTTPCSNPGPYLAGINKAACSAQGGTWCPSKADCSVLKECILTLADEAKSEERHAFEQYLRDAPEIGDSNDFDSCGRARLYFGFDELFINDQQICDDIEQLKYSSSFDFLDDFFKQGSDSTEKCGDDCEAPALELTKPDRTVSSSGPYQKHAAWKKANFGLKMAAQMIKFPRDILKGKSCPADPPFFIVHNTCQVAKDVIIHLLWALYILADKIYQTSDLLIDMISGSPSVKRAQENSEVIFDNMQLIADYLVDMRTEQLQGADRRDLKQLAGFADGSHVLSSSPSNHEIKKTPAAHKRSFQVKVEVLKNTAAAASTIHKRSLFVHSTIDGSLVSASYYFSKLVDNEREVPVVFDETNLRPGVIILHFDVSEADVKFLIMEATPLDGGDEVVNDIISFG